MFFANYLLVVVGIADVDSLTHASLRSAACTKNIWNFNEEILHKANHNRYFYFLSVKGTQKNYKVSASVTDL